MRGNTTEIINSIGGKRRSDVEPSLKEAVIEGKRVETRHEENNHLGRDVVNPGKGEWREKKDNERREVQFNNEKRRNNETRGVKMETNGRRNHKWNRSYREKNNTWRPSKWWGHREFEVKWKKRLWQNVEKCM